MGTDLKGGCSGIVAPSGEILMDLGSACGIAHVVVDVHATYMRPAGYGGQPVRNDDFINAGRSPGAFSRLSN